MFKITETQMTPPLNNPAAYFKVQNKKISKAIIYKYFPKNYE